MGTGKHPAHHLVLVGEFVFSLIKIAYYIAEASLCTKKFKKKLSDFASLSV